MDTFEKIATPQHEANEDLMDACTQFDSKQMKRDEELGGNPFRGMTVRQIGSFLDELETSGPREMAVVRSMCYAAGQVEEDECLSMGTPEGQARHKTVALEMFRTRLHAIEVAEANGTLAT